MNAALLTDAYTSGILVGLLFGTAARFIMLRTDYRQYPTYPHGRIIHISLGIIAAGLGSVAVPALLQKDYTAMTFLALAAQQFREVRNMERETLGKVDTMELVPRGAAYIEGIAMVFEGRNYLVIFTAFSATVAAILFAWYWGLLAGAIALVVSLFYKSGKTLSHIADIQIGTIRVEGPNLYVDDIYIMNVGLADNQQKIRRHGLGLVLTPRNHNCRVTLANIGQRQALLHDLSTILGVYRDTGEPGLIPMSKLGLDDGRVGIFLLPQYKNPQLALQMARKSPVLEGAVRMPSEAIAGQTQANLPMEEGNR